MNEQVEEIKTEIKRRLDVLQYQAHRGDARKELRRLLSFIGSMKKAPCVHYEEGWGCEISPSKMCDGCAQYAPKILQET